MKPAQTWNDVKRSETPLNWRKMLEHMTVTPEKLNAFLAEQLKKEKK